MRKNHHTAVVDLFKEHFKDNHLVGIEIGTAQALLTKTLLMHFPNLDFIYTIDPFLFVPGGFFEASVGDQAWHDDRRHQAEVALAVYEGRYSLLCTISDDAVSKTPNEVDFVYIDGDHSERQVYKDLVNYYPKVKNGGIFGGHDYHQVIKTLRDLMPEGLIFLGDDWTWWLIKDERVMHV